MHANISKPKVPWRSCDTPHPNPWSPGSWFDDGSPSHGGDGPPGRRWALRVMWELGDEPMRALDLKDRCDDMSSNVLYQRLRALSEAGLVARHDEGRLAITPLAAELRSALAPLTRGHAAGPTAHNHRCYLDRAFHHSRYESGATSFASAPADAWKPDSTMARPSRAAGIPIDGIVSSITPRSSSSVAPCSIAMRA